MVSVFSRITKILQANIHDLLDRAEDPEKMLAQLLRDWASAYEELRDQSATILVEQKMLEAERRLAERRAEECGRKAQAAVRQEDDELARELLRQRKTHSQSAEQFAAKVAELEPTVLQLRQQLRAMERKRQELERDGAIRVARWKVAKAQERVQRVLPRVSSYDPSGQLARIDNKIVRREARVQANAELAANTMEARLARLEELDPEIEAELLELKDAEVRRQLPPGQP